MFLVLLVSNGKSSQWKVILNLVRDPENQNKSNSLLIPNHMHTMASQFPNLLHNELTKHAHPEITMPSKANCKKNM